MASRTSAVEDLVTGGIDRGFWRGKRVLVTGHTGFKGSWLSLWLTELGARVSGLALAPPTEPSLFELARLPELVAGHEGDIRNEAIVAEVARAASPDIVFHLAAQPLVTRGYVAPVETFSTNVLGTVHLLEALRRVSSVRVVVLVTTDKVYEERPWPHAHREDDRLGGRDPYSASKAASEYAIACYRDTWLAGQGVAVASARAGNVIGGGDWAEARLLPDALRAWFARRCLVVRRPDAIRPWQHVLEPLRGYLLLAQTLWRRPELAGAWNFGPAANEAAQVRWVVERARQVFGEGDVEFLPQETGFWEAPTLLLDSCRSWFLLGATPRWSLADAIDRTVRWHLALAKGADARLLCLRDIAEFSSLRDPAAIS